MMSESGLLFVHFASTLIMVGIIWFVQVVHYPLMMHVGSGLFSEYSYLHQKLTSLVVAGPMLVEIGTAILLLATSATLRDSTVFLTATALLGMIWVSTVLWQMPVHKTLLAGYDETRIHRLIRTNWSRTAAWSLRGILIGELFWSISVKT